MKRILFFVLFFSGLSNCFGQNPQISGDLMLCPWTDGTATVANPTYDTYQWYSKYWFTEDEYVAIDGATQSTFTYDWYTYDQSLLKVVATINGQTYESNVIQVDSYAWASLTIRTTFTDSVSFDPDTESFLLCSGGSFPVELNMPYNASIQWYKDGVAIPGANSPEYIITSSGVYYVEAAPDFCPNATDNNQGLPIRVVEKEDCNLGIDDPVLKDNLVKIYPNPANAILQLEIVNGLTITDYCILDQSGKELMKNEIAGDTNRKQIDVTQLSNGFYFLKIKTDDGEIIKKFIKG
ncbi:T9SS type A sorting domain-containing protein [Flavobacterium amniphilum]|uniref:T9SS type A sorting domain-containing protein n=1 Tax=Flavobacterium amniphilum TaxID=1834035 RepID=UPI00202A693A|nr:T9SS type A sorting domain-containing protein [Flavobacterium amniphilum]MCL9807450.1 T9SS type A sorting domain-containing protein [Flavobacterium amniphilum]